MQEKIKDLLKEAMKRGDESAKLTYRALLTEFMKQLVATGKKPQDALTDEEAMMVVRREIKKREDSIKQFTDASRPELAESEIKEKEVLMQFLPAQLSQDEVDARVKEILSTMAPLDPKMMGKYVGMCIKELKDVASGDMVKASVEKIVV